ncbi:hypothetical protein MKW94_013068, partial [Papaver nudicaule]|nr:hypothetical protein [Papaver nudicaule]
LFSTALQLFFSVWTFPGIFWVFDVHSLSAKRTNLYSLCIKFLWICCLGYGVLLLAYDIIGCCLPRSQQDLKHTRGAAKETIIALPTFKFKLKDRDEDVQDTNSDGVGESGRTFEAGTEKECIISVEDAECSICLAEYADNEELRELPCAHFFHVDCVDKWLKKNGSCPLCKCNIRQTSENLQTPSANTNQPSAPE